MLIEQAIFTSTETDRASGYQLAATSPGIDALDLRDLRVWGPSHDSLVDSGDDAQSINFHPLPSGAYCVSKTTPAGSEYSGRRGKQIYTQCLVVPPGVLARFANNPFALVKAAFAQGSLCVHAQVPKQLAPFQLLGKAAAVDLSLVGQMAADPGGQRLGALVDRALRTTPLVLLAPRARERLIAGLINVLPIECRAAISFSTGLKPSPRRPFRLVGANSSTFDRAHQLRQGATEVFDASDPDAPCNPPAEGGWGHLVARILGTGRLAYFSAQLAQPRPGLRVDDLPTLAGVLWARMSAGRSGEVRPAAAPSRAADHDWAAARQADPRRADRAHRRLSRATAAEDASPGAAASRVAELTDDAPSQALALHCPEVMEKLEQLDDLVFEAIAGKAAALVQLKSLWPAVLAEIPRGLLEESRAQYIRHALRVWQECVDGDQIRNPALAVTTMEVVCLLFDC